MTASQVDRRVISVAIVDDHEMTGRGAAQVLREDAAGRFRVTGVVRMVAARAAGARAVVGKNHGPSLAEAVWDALLWADDAGPQLAQALLDAAAAGALQLARRYSVILDMLADGVPRHTVMERTELDPGGYAQEISRIRARCGIDGLARLDIPGPGRRALWFPGPQPGGKDGAGAGAGGIDRYRGG